MVYIILINWNGWSDTIECLESILRNDYEKFKIIVVDNNSKDNSLAHIRSWANGRLNYYYDQTNPLLKYSFPPVDKPVRFIEFEDDHISTNIAKDNEHEKITILKSNANLGFAGGNNLGLRYALNKNDFDYAWLLNNDTVIKNDALSELVTSIQLKQKIGMLGSTLIYYSQPDVIQALGGAKYNKWFSTTRHVGENLLSANLPAIEENTLQFDYIIGASMLVPKSFIDNIGLMEESYFLYYEELDWALRGKTNNWETAFAKDSIVYHKVGKSIGSNLNGCERSETADYYYLRNRIAITRKFYPLYICAVYVSFIIVIFNRIRRGQLNRLVNLFWKNN